jgi:uncharacterized protein DUF6404
MTRDEKIAHMLNDLAQRGIGRYTAAPPFYRLMWRLGLDVTPPPFASFTSTALVMGSFFAVAWGAVMWLMVWRTLPLTFTIMVAAIAGACFGLAMAAYHRWRMKPLGLPPWQDYPGPGAAS